MDFQKLLLKVSQDLGDDEVRALVFLCSDFEGLSLTSVTSACELLDLLMVRDLLSPERPWLLKELLMTIGRLRLVKELHLGDGESKTCSLVSPYRKMLFNLSEQIDSGDLKKIKFCLEPTIPRKKLADCVTTLDVFREMEHMDLLGDTKFEQLEEILDPIHRRLIETINRFKSQQASSVTSPPPLENLTLSEGQTNNNNEALGIYPMTSAKRGTCLILNNKEFVDHKRRNGTEKDEQCLREVFEWLGFDVDARLDCSAAQMRSALRELAAADHGQRDCAVCCILSHGLEGLVIGVDGGAVPIKQLRERVNGNACPSLAGKPKLFFIQACQGDKEQASVHVEADGPGDGQFRTDAVAVSKFKSIPSDADFLQAMSTVPSYVSFRDPLHGSWFIQSLCRNLVQLVPRGVDLMSILTKVNDDVSRKTVKRGGKKQMPEQVFRLRKRVIFPVPESPPPSLPDPVPQPSDDP